MKPAGSSSENFIEHIAAALKPTANPLQNHEALERAIATTLETQLVSAYCFRSVLRESCEHQIIAMNLISEGVSYDFFSAVIPVFARLGLKTNRYWTVHKDVDQQHLAMGIDLIPQCSPDSKQGKEYARIIEETTILYGQMLDSWSAARCHNYEDETIPACTAPLLAVV